MKKSDKKAIKLLAAIRQRIVKLVPDGNSDSIKYIMDMMGIDFDHYCFDLQISLNEKENKDLFDIGFTFYDLFKSTEEVNMFNSLISIPLDIIEGILSNTFLGEYKEEFDILSQKIYSIMGAYVSKKICLHRYPYASGVFFKQCSICREDKIAILYYYTLIKQAMSIDILVPDHIYQNINYIDSLCAKCKFRAVIIENIGQFMRNSRNPLAEELHKAIDRIMDSSFFSLNRSIKNNIHYEKTTVYERNVIEKIYFQQGVYLEIVLKILESKIKYSVGWKYQAIRFIADKTDSTMIEIRKKDKRIKRLEDVSIDEWEAAKKRLQKK